MRKKQSLGKVTPLTHLNIRLGTRWAARATPRVMHLFVLFVIPSAITPSTFLCWRTGVIVSAFIVTTLVSLHPLVNNFSNRNHCKRLPFLMSRIACSWVDLAGNEDAQSWYLNKHIPSVVESLNIIAYNGEMESSEATRDMFKDVAGIDSQYMTVFDLSENAATGDIDAHTEMSRNKYPKEARIDTRIYSEYAKMDGEEWSNSKSVADQLRIYFC
jgi:hypothetical protein